MTTRKYRVRLTGSNEVVFECAVERNTLGIQQVQKFLDRKLGKNDVVLYADDNWAVYQRDTGEHRMDIERI
jgi:hypothetical protein